MVKLSKSFTVRILFLAFDFCYTIPKLANEFLDEILDEIYRMNNYNFLAKI
jgi:hypothetical protein